MIDIKKKLISNTVMAYSVGRSALYFLESKPLPLIRRLFLGSKSEEPTEEFQKSSEKYLKKLLMEDADNIANGVYSGNVLSIENPKEHIKRLLKIWADAFFISYRQSKKMNKKFSKKAKLQLADAPDYYKRNFHNQTDGYSSDFSAEVYDHQVDLLFSGTTDAMRRSLLKPLRAYQEQGRKKLKILEIGCGSGSFTRYLSKTFPDSEITAIDLSKPYLKLARNKLSHSENISFMYGKAEELSFKDQAFDVVVSVFLFHELPYKIRQAVISESNRVLKSGGFMGLVDSLQIDDVPELNWALESFPKTFHEPFYKNYISHPIEDMLNSEFGVDSAQVSSHFLSKCAVIQKSL